jgi:hypothetical protein
VDRRRWSFLCWIPPCDRPLEGSCCTFLLMRSAAGRRLQRTCDWTGGWAEHHGPALQSRPRWPDPALTRHDPA